MQELATCYFIVRTNIGQHIARIPANCCQQERPCNREVLVFALLAHGALDRDGTRLAGKHAKFISLYLCNTIQGHQNFITVISSHSVDNFLCFQQELLHIASLNCSLIGCWLQLHMKWTDMLNRLQYMEIFSCLTEYSNCFTTPVSHRPFTHTHTFLHWWQRLTLAATCSSGAITIQTHALAKMEESKICLQRPHNCPRDQWITLPS